MEILNTLAHAQIFNAAWPDWLTALVLFWALVLGHAIADFPLQGEFLAVGKDRHADLSAATGGKDWPPSIWLYCLTIHSLIHAATVWVITGSVVLSVIEFILHWIIDLAKNESFTNFYVDQGLHIACKLVYAALILFHITLP